MGEARARTAVVSRRRTELVRVASSPDSFTVRVGHVLLPALDRHARGKDQCFERAWNALGNSMWVVRTWCGSSGASCACEGRMRRGPDSAQRAHRMSDILHTH